MKQSPELSAAQARMGRGALTRDGFLGTDGRDLLEILQDDDGRVRRLGLTHGEIAAALGRLTDAALAHLGAPAVLDDRFEVQSVEAMGRIPCPFGHPGLFVKAEIRARRLDTGDELVWTPLSVHLIGAHGFYQGRGSPYRLDPERLAAFLGLEGRAAEE
ncbi:hypothetical protein [Deferrisoma palaeochoriense]